MEVSDHTSQNRQLFKFMIFTKKIFIYFITNKNIKPTKVHRTKTVHPSKKKWNNNACIAKTKLNQKELYQVLQFKVVELIACNNARFIGKK